MVNRVSFLLISPSSPTKPFLVLSTSNFIHSTDDTEIKHVSQIIMNEVNLLQYDVDIKSSLQLSSADTTRCISVLEKYKNLDVTALMLKKNPQVAETIKRLRRYVGNTKEWNFTDEQRVEFNDKAVRIRKLADTIYRNFKVKLNYQTKPESGCLIFRKLTSDWGLFSFFHFIFFFYGISEIVRFPTISPVLASIPGRS